MPEKTDPTPSAQHALDPAAQLALERYKGRWVAVLGANVVAVGDSAPDVISRALKKGVTDPVVFRVPTNPEHISFY
jgi:hypothetical protein